MTRNPWQVLVGIWRNAILAFVRLPLLILGCFVLYVFLSCYWFYYLPFPIPNGLVDDVGYEVLRAGVFAPLMLGVMLTAIQASQAELWRGSIISVGAIIALRELSILALEQPVRFAKSQLVEMMVRHHQPYQPFPLFWTTAYVSVGLFFSLAVFLISVRLILLLPVVGLEDGEWRQALSTTWHRMKGSYAFALAVSFAALLPMLICDYLLGGLYRVLGGVNSAFVPPSFQQWEALMVRSAQYTFDCILIGSLAAGLYLTVRPGSVPASVAPLDLKSDNAVRRSRI